MKYTKNVVYYNQYLIGKHGSWGGICDKTHYNLGKEKKLVQQVYIPELAIFQITDQLNVSY